MTRVEFIFNVEDKFAKAADLCEKVVAKGRQLTFVASDSAFYSGLQNALWQTATTNFLPLYALNAAEHAAAQHLPLHFFLHGAEASSAALQQDDVLIHFLPKTPVFFSRFRYLVELVGLEEQDKAAARARFKFYRDRGYEIKTTDIRLR
jgi:DNA polymerase-3 subunit chi